ncbi:hypothetical protein D5086_022270 [Populus alba]|uniref:Uncharacterized protein n=1 Tax=Populus alba TaxID=43335 RepID=A0ACC4BEK9_POPAL
MSFSEAVTAREADSGKKGFTLVTKDHCLSGVEVVDGEEFTEIKSHSRPCLGLQRTFLFKELLIFTEGYSSIFPVVIH